MKYYLVFFLPLASTVGATPLAFADAASVVQQQLQEAAQQFSLAQRTHYAGEIVVQKAGGQFLKRSVDGLVSIGEGESMLSPETYWVEIALRAPGTDIGDELQGYDLTFSRKTSSSSFFLDGSAQRAAVNGVPDSLASVLKASLSGRLEPVPGLPEAASLSFAIDYPFSPVGWVPFSKGQLKIRKTADLKAIELANLLESPRGARLRPFVEIMDCERGVSVKDEKAQTLTIHLNDTAFAPGTALNLPNLKHVYAIPFEADIALSAEGSILAIRNLTTGTPYNSGGYGVDCHSLP